MRQQALDHYRAQRVTTASPAELIGLLYDAALASARAAGSALEQGRAGDVHEPLVRAQDVVTELRCALNLDAGDVAHRLDGIYAWCLELLVQANVQRRADKVHEFVLLFEPLRDAWRDACIGGAVPVAAEAS